MKRKCYFKEVQKLRRWNCNFFSSQIHFKNQINFYEEKMFLPHAAPMPPEIKKSSPSLYETT